MAERKQVILDTSVLINFLRIDRMDLLGKHPDYSFVITDHVFGEVADHYRDQKRRLNTSLKNGYISATRVSSDEEIAVFAELQKERRLGIGECSAFAAGHVRGAPVAIDDRVARSVASASDFDIKLLDTKDVMVSLIKAKVLTVYAADEIKAGWEENHRFTLRFDSFRDLVNEEEGG